MRKVIPVIIAIILIFGIIAYVFGDTVIEKYSYSKEEENLISYFGIEEENSMAILLHHEMLEEKAILQDGVCYFSIDVVQEYLNHRFYLDKIERWLIYTTPTELIQSSLGETEYTIESYDGEIITMEMPNPITISIEEEDEFKVYIAANFIQLYTNYEYQIYESPNRVQVNTQWGENLVAELKKDTQVRVKGGIKSPILTTVTKGEEVVVLEVMETWTKVKTKDGYIGYVENKMLEEAVIEISSVLEIYQQPEYTSLTKENKISMGWYVSANETLDQLLATTKGMNTIAPVWFSIKDEEGNITNDSYASFVSNAHAHGVEVWGTFDDFNYALNNQTTIDMYNVLAKTSTRQALIKNIIQATLNCGMDGINIDFEKINVDAGIHFIQFLRELSIQCRERGIILSVDNYVPMGFNQYYDLQEQGILADYVVIMGYDEHWGGGGVAGSVASINYVLQGIQNTIEKVPAHKVINALPFYTRVWKTNNGVVTDEAITLKNVESYVQRNNLDYQWDEETCQNYAEWAVGETSYQIWLEDAQSISAKLNVMQAHAIGGVAVWRLGYEQADIWNLISAYSSQ